MRILIKTTSMVDTRMSLTVLYSPIFKKFIFVNIVSLCFKRFDARVSNCIFYSNSRSNNLIDKILIIMI